MECRATVDVIGWYTVKITKERIGYTTITESIVWAKASIAHDATAKRTQTCGIIIASTTITTIYGSIRIKSMLLAIGYQ